MTRISNLPRDLVEEVLSRVPLTSIRRVRASCKGWYTISKDMSFAKKHLSGQAKIAAEAKEFMLVTVMDFRLHIMSVRLYNNVELCIKREGKVINLGDSEEIDISRFFHCNGLLLCITNNNTRLEVWNPYWGRTKCIETTHDFLKFDRYKFALGYDESSKSHKILRFLEYMQTEFEIYDLNSDSWRILDLTPDWKIQLFARGVCHKGNTYWISDNFLVCFNFSKERFGPRLPLPFEYLLLKTVSLSIVREEQIAVLFQRCETFQMEVWVTTKIEPNTVSWNSKVFLTAHSRFLFVNDASFFIDEEKRVVVIFDKDKESFMYPKRNVAYIIEADGTLKRAVLGESPLISCYPLVSSYVPSLCQI